LPHAFNFLSVFGKAREGLTTTWPQRFQHPTPDGYQFFLELGPLSNVNERYFKNEIDFWNKMVAHPNYDEFWQKRNLLPHLKNIKCAVMTVGGWFDAEDLYGPLQIYRSAEKNNPGIFNMLVMGPWPHGGWNRTNGESLGNIKFGYETAEFYRKNIQLPFFNHYLKGKGNLDLPEAFVFETGANRWRRFDEWPPENTEKKNLYLRAEEGLSFQAPADTEEVYDEYVSDPDKPVPFTMDISTGMTRPYMTDDQRFAAQRPDVLVYETDLLEEDVTLVGPITANLWVSTSGTASDWIVKLIDVFPDDAKETASASGEYKMGGYQMMVRSEVIRGRFRDSYENPKPFEPNQVTLVDLELQDVLHTFKRGHRIMVQIQSTWFPLVDRNPQKYVPNIYGAAEGDFVEATQRVYRSTEHATHLEVGVLKQEAIR
jgi:putative CocE/NonD family hydrolase